MDIFGSRMPPSNRELSSRNPQPMVNCIVLSPGAELAVYGRTRMQQRYANPAREEGEWSAIIAHLHCRG